MSLRVWNFGGICVGRWYYSITRLANQIVLHGLFKCPCIDYSDANAIRVKCFAYEGTASRNMILSRWHFTAMKTVMYCILNNKKFEAWWRLFWFDPDFFPNIHCNWLLGVFWDLIEASGQEWDEIPDKFSFPPPSYEPRLKLFAMSPPLIQTFFQTLWIYLEQFYNELIKCQNCTMTFLWIYTSSPKGSQN